MTPDSFGLVGRWNRAVSATSASREERRERRLVIMRFFFLPVCFDVNRDGLVPVRHQRRLNRRSPTVPAPQFYKEFCVWIYVCDKQKQPWASKFETVAGAPSVSRCRSLQLSWNYWTASLPMHQQFSQHSAMQRQLVGWVYRQFVQHMQRCRCSWWWKWTNHRGERVWSGEEQEHY